MTDPDRARFVEWIETAMHNAQMMGTSPWAHAAELAAECIERAVRAERADFASWRDKPIPWAAAMEDEE